LIWVRVLVPVQLIEQMSKLSEYVKSSYDELMNKVSWPSWDDLQESTIIVMIAALIIALLIGVIDIASGFALGFFYKLF
jgi:preprotein translocase subunit SecE